MHIIEYFVNGTIVPRLSSLWIPKETFLPDFLHCTTRLAALQPSRIPRPISFRRFGLKVSAGRAPTTYIVGLDTISGKSDRLTPKHGHVCVPGVFHGWHFNKSRPSKWEGHWINSHLTTINRLYLTASVTQDFLSLWSNSFVLAYNPRSAANVSSALK